MTNAVRTVEPVQGPSFLAPASTNAGPLAQPPGLGLGANKALSSQGDKSCAAVHGTRITVTSTGAGDDAMEVEAVGDTADRRGDDAEAGVRMDCDDDIEEGGVPWVTVPKAPVQPSEGEPSGLPLPKNKRSRRSEDAMEVAAVKSTAD